MKNIGQEIHNRGGFTAMQANFYIFFNLLIPHDPAERAVKFRDLKYLWDGIGDWIELYKKFEGGFCLEQNYTQNIRRRWHCKDVSSHCCKVASRRVLMRSILTILLETKNQLEKCYRDYYYFFLEGLGLR